MWKNNVSRRGSLIWKKFIGLRYKKKNFPTPKFDIKTDFKSSQTTAKIGLIRLPQGFLTLLFYLKRYACIEKYYVRSNHTFIKARRKNKVIKEI